MTVGLSGPPGPLVLRLQAASANLEETGLVPREQDAALRPANVLLLGVSARGLGTPRLWPVVDRVSVDVRLHQLYQGVGSRGGTPAWNHGIGYAYTLLSEDERSKM